MAALLHFDEPDREIGPISGLSLSGSAEERQLRFQRTGKRRNPRDVSDARGCVRHASVPSTGAVRSIDLRQATAPHPGCCFRGPGPNGNADHSSQTLPCPANLRLRSATLQEGERKNSAIVFERRTLTFASSLLPSCYIPDLPRVSLPFVWPGPLAPLEFPI